MRAHAAFWAIVRAKGTTLGARTIAENAANDPQKASDWLKERADRTDIDVADGALLGRIGRYKEASTNYVATIRTGELLRLSQACRASDEAKQALRSVSTILSCLISDVGWQVPGDSRSSVVGAIRAAATAIEAATTVALLSSEDEVSDMVAKWRDDESRARRKLHEVIAAGREDKSFSDIYLTRDQHPGKMQTFSALGWLDVEDVLSYVSANTLRDGSEEAEAGDSSIRPARSKRKGKAKRRRARSNSSS
ncbi:hypothetical protein PHYSODRAFT_303043 [Phytophthora sojae]|uniref:Uncharacterized protein n=2 Tax=Phytophthora sojae (strain P6497) TaxID=1094619 RepID=G4ZUL0_PHYSP|nr:hypothetical protein PHYSODRAFT_303039 [Phytophthora sojae]XP_009530929.1 hypothetical protein PHYSODRAFT_303043 [Phytophthora sojae]EGZ13484.1 hypothetical protein PHYSODRAFT_303039 [Phytophthora sojae]EGZ13500.1 hypothetical protein PHYSODRAFT_303043 [Phytophthora sojae]|eukprot:XP_009530913.1 hypothetical protein PHYSODRAFT_303039 [Phytophthora sojae]